MTTDIKFDIYTDGACSGNPGPGGWAYCIIDPQKNKPLSIFGMEIPEIPDVVGKGGEEDTTNNRMELTAVLEAMERLFVYPLYKVDLYTKVRVYTDSQLVIKCANGEYKRKKNLDLWKKYDELSIHIGVEWCWVKGHSGNFYNDFVDRIAREESLRFKKKHKK